MKIALSLFFCWCVGLLFDTAITGSLLGISSSALLILSLLICIFWDSEYSYLVALFFGITSDSFSSIVFGIYGLSFFLMAILVRFSLKYIDMTYFFLSIFVAIILLIYHILVIVLRVLIQNGFHAASYFKGNLIGSLAMEMLLNIFLFTVFFYCINMLQKKFKIF